LLLNNILLTGGSSAFPGFIKRFESEVRSGLENSIKIYHSTDPGLFTLALRDFANSKSFVKNSISKKVYEEFGSFALTKMLNL
jgi:actin-related protein